MSALRQPRCGSLVLIFIAAIAIQATRIAGQLPDDIQRELNQNLAEQARIQALRQQHQQQIQNRAATNPSSGGKLQARGQASGPQQQAHDPNNYSYQQVSPPIQYSYYQPYGDAAAQPQAGGQQQQAGGQQPAAAPKIDFDLNNLNFDLPQPQAQVAAQQPQQASAASGQPQLVPSFTGAGGLPVMRPPAAQSATGGYVPAGQAPLAPQARVQQGPPLTEADFKDITGGENYGAPGGDFGISGANQSPQSRSTSSDTDAQLREFGLPGGEPAQASRRSSPASQMGIPDFGAFGPMGGSSGNRQPAASNPMADFGNFGNMGESGAPGFPELGRSGGAGNNQAGGSSQPDFDFASQPSSNRGDQAASTVSGGAPGSLQSLLGSGFPGLGGNANSGLDDFTRGGNNPQQQGDEAAQSGGPARSDDGAMDIADLGDKSDQFSGADLGGFEQPGPQNDQDFNYGATPAASEQQPKTVPYPDSSPQPVGTLWALTQPQSLTQTRYNALPDKGTYQDYPAYDSGGNDFGAVANVVDGTPRARRAGPGRYATPSASELTSENRPAYGQQYDYSQPPASSAQVSRFGF